MFRVSFSIVGDRLWRIFLTLPVERATCLCPRNQWLNFSHFECNWCSLFDEPVVWWQRALSLTRSRQNKNICGSCVAARVISFFHTGRLFSHKMRILIESSNKSLSTLEQFPISIRFLRFRKVFN